jgi:hypothetical protein
MQCLCAILASLACPPLQYNSAYLVKGSIFEKKLFNTKYVFRSCLKTLSKTFLILRSERDMIKNVCWLSCEVPLFLSDFSETRISSSFEKSSNIKFHENPSSRSRVFSCERTERQTDIHEEANCHFSPLISPLS